MRILGIETSGSHGGIAIVDDDTVRHEHFLAQGMIHGRDLVPAIREAEEKLSLPLSSIDLVAVDIGPGSYTGLRVGVQTAKVLAYALGKPIIGVSSLDVLARNIAPDRACSAFAPIRDAKWDQVYAAVYRFEEGKPARTTNYLAEKPEHLCTWLKEGTLIYGDGAVRFRSIFESRKVAWGRDEDGIPRPSHVAFLGREAYLSGVRHDIFKIVPMYLRPTEAEVKNTNIKPVN